MLVSMATTRLRAFQEVEELIPVRQVDAGQQPPLDGLQLEAIHGAARLTEGEPLAQRLVDDVLQRAILIARTVISQKLSPR